MNQWIITIIGGLVVALIASWFGIGKKTKVVVKGVRVRKTGKWIIIISVTMIIIGFILYANTMPSSGKLIIGYGFLFFLVGKVVAWFQKF